MAEEAPRLFIGDLLANYVCRPTDAYEVADKVLAAIQDHGYVLAHAGGPTEAGASS